MIKYSRKEDGTFVKEGEIGAVPAVHIKIGGSAECQTDYTLAQAQEIIEAAIAKGQTKHDAYFIIPVAEKGLSGAAAAKVKAAAAVELTPEEEAAVQAILVSTITEGSDDQRRAVAIKQLRKDQKAAAKAADKAAKAAAKPPKAAKPVVTFSEAEETRIAAIMATPVANEDSKEGVTLDRAGAVKVLRKEQRIQRLADARAAKPKKAPKAPKEPKAPKAPKAPREPKTGGIDGTQVAALYAAGKSVGAIAKELGKSYMGIRLNLIKQNLLKKAE